jgi:hypothetical protein
MIRASSPITSNFDSLEEHFRDELQNDRPMVLIPYGLMAFSGFGVGLALGLFIGFHS